MSGTAQGKVFSSDMINANQLGPEYRGGVGKARSLVTQTETLRRDHLFFLFTGEVMSACASWSYQAATLSPNPHPLDHQGARYHSHTEIMDCDNVAC